MSGLGCLRTILAEPAKFIPCHFIKKKWPQLKKKVLKLGIQKVFFFLYIELNKIGQNFTKI